MTSTTKPNETLYPGPDVCGRIIGGAKRIIGGTKAVLKEFPWMALLLYKNNSKHTSLQPG